jgi:hypothetical protein
VAISCTLAEMLKSIFGTTVISECISLLAAIIILNRKTKFWLLFIPFLVVTALVDIAGSYMRFVLQQNNFSYLYNILLIMTISFYLLFYTMSAVMEKKRRVLLFLFLIFNLYAVGNLFFFQGFFNYNYYTEVFGDIIIVFSLGFFYYRLLTEEISRLIHRDAFFWLSSGLLLFSLGSIVLYLFRPVIKKYYLTTHINLGGTINDVLNVMLYLSFIIAFICQRNTKSSPAL